MEEKQSKLHFLSPFWDSYKQQSFLDFKICALVLHFGLASSKIKKNNIMFKVILLPALFIKFWSSVYLLKDIYCQVFCSAICFRLNYVILSTFDIGVL